MKSRTDFELQAFEEMLEGKPMRPYQVARFAASTIFDPFLFAVKFLPGASGYGLRRLYYSYKLAHLGRNCILDIGMTISGPQNVSVGDYTWIDAYTTIGALFGPVTIGRRIHIGTCSIINAGPDGVEIHDYVGVGPGARIFGHTEAAREGKRMSGPMIPWRYKAFKQGPVILEKDVCVGTNAIILPGITVGEGAVIGASSVVTRDIEPWTMVFGSPARVFGRRDKVTVPDI